LRLYAALGAEQVFLDSENIDDGDRFPRALAEAVLDARVRKRASTMPNLLARPKVLDRGCGPEERRSFSRMTRYDDAVDRRAVHEGAVEAGNAHHVPARLPCARERRKAFVLL
jgi:hypothetical protein